MSEGQTEEINPTDQTPSVVESSKVRRIPKPNAQTIVLALVAIITLAQTVQLIRISSKANAATVRAAAPSSSSPDSTDDGTNVPQAMVGGC